MSQQWPNSQVDTRNFGQQIQRTLDDLNRPTLQNIVVAYLQDAMRFWQRKPFFYTDIDNTTPLLWTASVNTVTGTTIQYTSTTFNPGVVYNFVCGNLGKTGTVQPNFESVLNTIFVTPAGTGFPPALPPPPAGTGGTVVDGTVIWLNNGPTIGGFAANTQLTTLYNVNQYDPPIDLISFTRVEVTWAATIRQEMQPLSYDELRNLDVIRPTPPTTYPTNYCYYQQNLYLWPYPVSLYPITLSYRSAPPLAVLPTDSNIWTTQAEAMVRHYAESRVQAVVIGDQAMADMTLQRAMDEYYDLQQETSQVDVRAPIPPSEW